MDFMSLQEEKDLTLWCRVRQVPLLLAPYPSPCPDPSLCPTAPSAQCLRLCGVAGSDRRVPS